MTLDEIRNQFRTKDPRLVNIIIEAARWVKPLGFTTTSTPTRDGSPGNTVKFIPKGGGPMLFSLQFHNNDGPFLFFKWTKNTVQRLGIDEALYTRLFEEIRPLIRGRGEKEDAPTEWRLYLEPSDESRFPRIKSILTPLIKTAAEASQRNETARQGFRIEKPGLYLTLDPKNGPCREMLNV